jgi:DNA repair exonuclease SbcCD ATPase subunit
MDIAESHPAADEQPDPDGQPGVEGRRRIGEIFVELGFITSSQLEEALDVQREKGGRIGEILVAQGSLTRLDLASALAEHWEPHRFSLPPSGRSRGGGDAAIRLASKDHAAIAELDERLRSAEERIGSVEGSSAARASFMGRKKAVSDLQDRLAYVEQLVGSLAALNLRVTTLEQGLDQFDALRESDAVATAARIASAESGLEKRLEWVESRQGVVATLEEGLDALDLRLKAIEATVGSRLAELADAVRAREDDAVALRQDFAELHQAVDERAAAAERAASSLKLETGSLAARLDELQGPRAGDSQELRRATEQVSARMDDLARRLDAQAATHEEHVVVTERALLEEVTALRAMVEALEERRAEPKLKKKGKKRKHDGAGPPDPAEL